MYATINIQSLNSYPNTALPPAASHCLPLPPVASHCLPLQVDRELAAVKEERRSILSRSKATGRRMSRVERHRTDQLAQRQTLLENRSRRLDREKETVPGGRSAGGGGGGGGAGEGGGVREDEAEAEVEGEGGVTASTLVVGGTGGGSCCPSRGGGTCDACSCAFESMRLPAGVVALSLSLLLVASLALSCADRFFNGQYAHGFILENGANFFNPLDAALVYVGRRAHHCSVCVCVCACVYVCD